MNNYYQKREGVEKADLHEFVFGKAQPQAIEVEDSILGAILSQPEAYGIVSDILRESSFYLEANQLIFRAISELGKFRKPIDIITVTNQLRAMELVESIGGAYHLVELTNKVSFVIGANLEYYAKILVQEEIKRAEILAATQVIRLANDPSVDAFDLMDEAAKKRAEIEAIPLRIQKIATMNAIALKVLNDLDKSKSGELTGIPTGYPDLDRVTNGWQRKDLIILAARPSMGKSLVAVNLALNAAKMGSRVALFSLEMADDKIYRRMAMAESNVSNDMLIGKDILTADDEQIFRDTVEKISTMPIDIDDTANQTARMIHNKVWNMNKSAIREIVDNNLEERRGVLQLKKTGEVDLIIVDYLQKMKGENLLKGANKEQEISSISNALKTIAKTFNVPVIALAQLNRSVETRGGSKKPQLSDLRDSGAIEQDADVVGFVYRPVYYQIMETESGESTKDLLQILIQKNREGALADIDFKVNLLTQKLSKWSNYDEYPTTSVAPQDNIIKGIRGSFGEGNDTNESESALPKPIGDGYLPF